MSSILAVLVYLIAFGLPIYLLYRFHSQHWSWHVLAIACAIGLGLVHTPPELQTPGFDLLFGSLFAALTVWGVGGLILYRTHVHHGHHEKHA